MRKKKAVTISQLELLTAFVDDLSLECDGVTRLLHLVLHRENIPHVCHVGYIRNTANNEVYEPHFWIELYQSHLIIDYRLRMWKGETWGNVPVPHGVFSWRGLPYDYTGAPVEFTLAECEVVEQMALAELSPHRSYHESITLRIKRIFDT